MNQSTEALRPAAPAEAADPPTASVDAIEAMYRMRAARYRRLAAAVAGGDVVGDIVQDAFARALRRRSSWRGDGPLEAWLWRLVLNAAGDADRRRLRRERLTGRLTRGFESSSSPPASVDDALHGRCGDSRRASGTAWSSVTTATSCTPRLPPSWASRSDPSEAQPCARCRRPSSPAPSARSSRAADARGRSEEAGTPAAPLLVVVSVR
jgi:DNA-directed RNA polymerase specialized sigma24 family protein